MRKIEEESTAGVDYLDDCKKIQAMIRKAGYEATLLECQDYWEWESDKFCAGWLFFDRCDISELDIRTYLDEQKP
tara:strand:+ start:926 stop:1150 length:225 start_codon:yes stop_codon:yes gene_type:complete